MFRAFLSAAIVAMCLCNPAKAHPHRFVEDHLGFHFKSDGRLDVYGDREGGDYPLGRSEGAQVVFVGIASVFPEFAFSKSPEATK